MGTFEMAAAGSYIFQTFQIVLKWGKIDLSTKTQSEVQYFQKYLIFTYIEL